MTLPNRTGSCERGSSHLSHRQLKVTRALKGVDILLELNSMESTTITEHQTSDFEVEMTSDVEDPETFDAIFPRAPVLIKQHELLPLVEKLRTLIACPSHMFAAMLPPRTGVFGVQTISNLETKLKAYSKQKVEDLEMNWQHTLKLVSHREAIDDAWADARLLDEVDLFMMKLTLYYVKMWKYICTIGIGIVHAVETRAVELQNEWMQIVNSNKTKFVPSETLVRPLRLRSESIESMESSAAARRSRLARQSNEFMVAWFLAHKSNPYPSASERVQIAEKTGLSEQQVRNWFANMRKRHWKPKNNGRKKPRCLLDMLLRKPTS